MGAFIVGLIVIVLTIILCYKYYKNALPIALWGLAIAIIVMSTHWLGW